MQKIYVFPGQGSQLKGMGEAVFGKFITYTDLASDILGYSIVDLCLEDRDQRLNQTQYTQPALYTVSALTYLDRLQSASGNEQVAYFAGHSLGEYCALFAAGGFDFATGLQLVQRRGQLMSQAPRGGMAAVLGLSEERVRTVLRDKGLDAIDLANINSPDQIILSGLHDDIVGEATRAIFEQAGASYVPLNVSAAFHSRYMQDVEREFADYLAGFSLQPLSTPVVSNMTARPYPQRDYAAILSGQITHPVKWYESISWLLTQDIQPIEELGPGNVLSKLTDKIVKAPMAIAPTAAPPAPVAPAPRDTIFMYGGQGTQYFQMGRELYQHNPAFRQQMDACSALVEAESGFSLVKVIYDESRRVYEPFDSILQTHPALFAVGYSLTAMLRAEGVEPRAVLGYSLGEYIGLTVSGCLSWQDGLRLTLRQSRVLAEHCPKGGMLSVLAPVEHLQQHPGLYQGVELAGINFADNFCVSGARADLARIKQGLDAMGVICIELPVQYPFHSSNIEPVRDKILAILEGIEFGAPRIPYYSSTFARAIHAGDLGNARDYLWRVIRQSVDFHGLVKHLASSGSQALFVDLSATGSLANFIKYTRPNSLNYSHSINQFGKDLSNLHILLNKITGRSGE
ncbi:MULTISPECIES: ACP S-malonyltransferase [Pseudomonas]|uniref:[acyl-carrier-protein] S-malonyltransferase n=1 Tax=Pseudomonas baetica TaxID=674054 RepID=A0ABX4Q4L6_9PSED|nr:MULTISPECIES: ACP S-malonyltransferase [Pseudomonas]MDR9863549.1 ACP S-malonyltransferase [Pseudomonas baetica]PKA71711.1 malonyl CoA-acyl carrier protein transacylase [Pseudomonas baetica]PTC20183.1 [acyl-carrier-protein] S-malonyltransferase [Pseudomonas baetica]